MKMTHGRTIHNEAAYARGTERRIKENARKGRAARWLVEDPTRQEIVEYLKNMVGAHPGFLGKMADAMLDWGSLTAGQEAAVRKTMAGNIERKEARAAENAKSEHIGTVGERWNFNLTVAFVTDYETDFGVCYVYGMKDENDNIVIYKGQFQDIAKGAQVSVKATIKAHSERDGVKQTIIVRPKFTVTFRDRM